MPEQTDNNLTIPRDRLMSVAELADYLSLAKSTLFTWRAAGRGPRSFKVGDRIVYRTSEVNDWIDAQERATARGGAA